MSDCIHRPFLGRLFDVTGKKALVTGSTQGLGRAIAEALFLGGASMVYINGRTAEKCNNVVRDIVSQHKAELGDGAEARLTALPGSVSDVLEVKNMMDKTNGEIDILVNNAGINIPQPLDEITTETFDAVLSLNLRGLWAISHAVIPHMKKQKWGRIINLGSILSHVGMAETLAYSASKGAVLQMTKVMAIELAPHGITVNALCPGVFDTPMNRHLITEAVADPSRTESQEEVKKREVQQKLLNSIPLARFGLPQELQGAVLMLCGAASGSYITGTSLTVDGGFTSL